MVTQILKLEAPGVGFSRGGHLGRRPRAFVAAVLDLGDWNKGAGLRFACRCMSRGAAIELSSVLGRTSARSRLLVTQVSRLKRYCGGGEQRSQGAVCWEKFYGCWPGPLSGGGRSRMRLGAWESSGWLVENHSKKSCGLGEYIPGCSLEVYTG